MSTGTLPPEEPAGAESGGSAFLEVADQAVIAATEPPPAGKRRRRPAVVKPWFIRFHRWTSMAVAVLLLLECVTGAVLLFGPELQYVGHGDRFHKTDVAISQEFGPQSALHKVQEEVPGFEAATDVYRFRGIWLVSGEETADKVAFVDPGTGEINDVARPDSWFQQAMVQIHDCFFTCEGTPLYSPWMAKTLPGFFGEEMTVGWWILGLLGLMLTFLCLTGIWIWFPQLRKFSSGFKVRRKRGSYVRDLDLHKVVGIISIPFLLMWGVSGMAFPYAWVTDAYYAAVPGSPQPEPPEMEPGTGPLITEAEATAKAVALHPDGWMTGYFEYDLEGEEGSYAYYFTEGFDTYKDGYIGTAYVQVDSHGGSVVDYRKPSGNAFERYWADWQYGAHFGTFVPWIPRAVFWLTFGIAPVLLGITGITIWLVKWRSRRNRAERKKLVGSAGSDDEDEPAATS